MAAVLPSKWAAISRLVAIEVTTGVFRPTVHERAWFNTRFYSLELHSGCAFAHVRFSDWVRLRIFFTIQPSKDPPVLTILNKGEHEGERLGVSSSLGPSGIVGEDCSNKISVLHLIVARIKSRVILKSLL